MKVIIVIVKMINKITMMSKIELTMTTTTFTPLAIIYNNTIHNKTTINNSKTNPKYIISELYLIEIFINIIVLELSMYMSIYLRWKICCFSLSRLVTLLRATSQ